MLSGEKSYPLRKFVISFGVLFLGLALARNNIFWSSLSVFYLILMLSVLKISIKSPKKTELDSFKKFIFIWSLLPLSIGSMVIYGRWGRYLLLEEIAFVFFLFIFSIMTILILENRTKLKSNIQFTGIFLYSFPIGVGAIRSIARFLSDQFFHTQYFHGNSHFMLELLIITVFSFYIGYLLKYYLKHSKYSSLIGMDKKMEIWSPFEINKEDLLKFLNSVFNKFNRSELITVSTFFQWSIYGVIIYGLIVDNHPVTVWALFSFGISVVPELLTKNTKSGLPAIIYFWSTFVLFVYAVGRPLGFYSLSDWWAEVTHFLAGSAVALVFFSLLVYFDDRYENLSLPKWVIPPLILLFIFTIGVFWEITEFYIDIIFDTSTQAGLEDTAYDLIFNFLGAIFSLTTISLFSQIDIFHPYRSKLLEVLKR